MSTVAIVEEASDEMLNNAHKKLKGVFSEAISIWISSWYSSKSYHPRVSPIIKDLLEFSDILPSSQAVSILQALDDRYGETQHSATSQIPNELVTNGLRGMLLAFRAWNFLILRVAPSSSLSVLCFSMFQTDDQLRLLLRELDIQEKKLMFCFDHFDDFPVEIQELVMKAAKMKETQRKGIQSGYIEFACRRALLEASLVFCKQIVSE
jgi:hypothetical protein